MRRRLRAVGLHHPPSVHTHGRRITNKRTCTASASLSTPMSICARPSTPKRTSLAAVCAVVGRAFPVRERESESDDDRGSVRPSNRSKKDRLEHAPFPSIDQLLHRSFHSMMEQHHTYIIHRRPTNRARTKATDLLLRAGHGAAGRASGPVCELTEHYFSWLSPLRCVGASSVLWISGMGWC